MFSEQVNGQLAGSVSLEQCLSNIEGELVNERDGEKKKNGFLRGKGRQRINMAPTMLDLYFMQILTPQSATNATECGA